MMSHVCHCFKELAHRVCLSGVVVVQQCKSPNLPLREQLLALQDTRGRWSSIDTVLHLGWSVSAVAGGFLLDRFSFAGVFLATASIQVGATNS